MPGTDARITRVIGGRYREDYAGIAEGAAANMPADELILPVSYVYATGTFRPKGYSVMSPERPGLRAGPVWSRTCIFCHNTAPLLSTALGGLRGAGAASYQGEQVDVASEAASAAVAAAVRCVALPPHFKKSIARNLQSSAWTP